jgi:hypothetical protein
VQLEWDEQAALESILHATGFDGQMLVRAYIRMLARKWKESRDLLPLLSVIVSALSPDRDLEALKSNLRQSKSDLGLGVAEMMTQTKTAHAAQAAPKQPTKG